MEEEGGERFSILLCVYSLIRLPHCTVQSINSVYIVKRTRNLITTPVDWDIKINTGELYLCLNCILM